jgi:transposase
VSVPLPPLEEFFSLFRDDNDCLEFLWRTRVSADGRSALCPECGEAREFRSDGDETTYRQWRCVSCGCFLSPIAGTIFQKSRTPIHVFFDAIGVLSEPGRPVQAKELAYELGVSFTTAAEVIRALDGRLDTRDGSAPRFTFEIVATNELAGASY